MVAIWGPAVRFRIDELGALSGAGVVHVVGRLVHVEATRALLEDATGAVWLEGAFVDGQLGAVVSVEGRPRGGTVEVLGLSVLARAKAWPRGASDDRWLADHDRRRHRFLRQRAAIVEEIRDVLADRGLLEVETPVAVASPGLDVHLDAEPLADGRYLSTSPEYQMKRLLSAGVGDIFQIAKCFRRGERGARHQPEFTMLEWYRSPGTLDDVLADTEEVVRAAARAVGRTSIAGERAKIELGAAFERMSVADAFQRIAGLDVQKVLPDEERFFRIVVDVIEPALGRSRPVFLTRWPASMASLARLCDDDPRYAERAELFIDGLELSNGFFELTDPDEQRRRLVADQAARKAAGLPVYPIDERFLAALEDGIPPSGGNALGLDRLVMLACGTRDIEDVVAIPNSRL